MRHSDWPTSLLLLSLLTTGCAFPGRQQANNSQQPGWGSLAPNVGYLQGEAVEEENDFPDKKITDPNPLKIQYAKWMEETGQLAEARLHYSEVITAQPKNIDAHLGMARVDLAQGQIDSAEQGYHRVLKLDRDNAYAHSGLGQCLSARKDWTSAVTELNLANKSLPEDKTIRYQLAVALVHTGNLAAAQVQFAECVGEAAGHYNTALILKDKGNLDEAESQLQLALRKDPQLKDAQRWLVEIRKVRGQVGAALPAQVPAAIRPTVKQVTYHDYGPIGTVDVEPAVYVLNDASADPPADGHSTSAQ
jgi:tetratricopeptide (TPR) repeat protein